MEARSAFVVSVLLVGVLSVLGTNGSAQRRLSAAVPLEPVDTIAKAFKNHRLVAIGEAHGNSYVHAFLRALIRDPRFTAVANDVVVEFGNTLYQDVIDRFVRGEDVPEASLQRVWNYTTVGLGVWGRDPLYESFYREVRAVNATLPPARQLRVVLGDPPVDWERPDLGGFVRRRSGDGVEWPTDDERYARRFHAASVIQREVIAKRRRALVIYGTHHVIRGQGIIGILEQRFRTKVFVIAAPIEHDLAAVQANIASWPIPSLTMVPGTVLGPLESDYFYRPVSGRTLLRNTSMPCCISVRARP